MNTEKGLGNVDARHLLLAPQRHTFHNLESRQGTPLLKTNPKLFHGLLLAFLGGQIAKHKPAFQSLPAELSRLNQTARLQQNYEALFC